MSKSLNKVTLIGNLGQDPEVRSIANGGRVANFSIATSRSWGGTGGAEKQEKTDWHRIVAWNNSKSGTGLADIIEKYVKKGDKIYVEGRIENRSWQDKDGQTKYTTEIIANDIILLGGRGSGGGEGGSYASAKAGASSAPKKEGKESFDDFPAALDSEDDDLPF